MFKLCFAEQEPKKDWPILVVALNREDGFGDRGGGGWFCVRLIISSIDTARSRLFERDIGRGAQFDTFDMEYKDPCLIVSKQVTSSSLNLLQSATYGLGV